ncbi:hypothetical protein D6825_00895 [Candidatus Woesearchaeota archaeon]|nr:MAG: hypothetical protein D6825_00895 [Candidatus Woesearchaeota archaeon]
MQNLKEKATHLKKLRKHFRLIPQLIISIVFLTHGIMALRFADEFLDLVLFAGFGLNVAKMLLVIVGLVDLSVAVGVLFFPTVYILAYASFWPLVPTALTYFSTGELEGDVFLIMAMAYLAYSLNLKKKARWESHKNQNVTKKS